MREERKRAAAELKKAQHRKRRLKTKARQLSNEDLLAVLLLRQEQRAASDHGEECGSARLGFCQALVVLSDVSRCKIRVVS